MAGVVIHSARTDRLVGIEDDPVVLDFTAIDEICVFIEQDAFPDLCIDHIDGVEVILVDRVDKPRLDSNGNREVLRCLRTFEIDVDREEHDQQNRVDSPDDGDDANPKNITVATTCRNGREKKSTVR